MSTQNILLIAGLGFILAAIVGGGLKFFGITIPVLESRPSQVLVGVAGVILIVLRFTIAAVPSVPTEPLRVRPENLALSTPPLLETEARLLHEQEALYKYAEGEQTAVRIADFRVRYARTPDFPTDTPEFKWHLKAGAYEIYAEHAYLWARGQTEPDGLERDPSSTESELIYTVRPAKLGDHVSIVVMVLSKTGEIEGNIPDIVTSFAR